MGHTLECRSLHQYTEDYPYVLCLQI
jgi:hypothetical protein